MSREFNFEKIKGFRRNFYGFHCVVEIIEVKSKSIES